MTSSVLFQSFGLHIGGIFFLTLISLLHVQKKKGEKRTETGRLFDLLIGSTYFLNIFQILSFTFKYFEEAKGVESCGILAMLCARGFTFSAMFFGALFESYFLKKMVFTEDNPKVDRKIYLITQAVCFILFIISCFFEIKFHTDSDKFVLNGNFSIWTYTEFATAVVTLIYCFIHNRKNLNFLKGMMLLFVPFSYLTISFLEDIGNYDISEIPYILSLYIVTIYFTLENTNYLKTQELKNTEIELRNSEILTSNNINEKSQNIIGYINDEYIDINYILNSNLTDEELNEHIDRLITYNNGIVSSLTQKEEGKE